MTRRSRLALASVLILAAAVIAAWGLWAAFSGPPSIVVTRSPMLDKPAPPIVLQSLDGSSTVRLADYIGRPVMVNFWASWCLPCRAEFPLLASARAAHAADGLEILGIVHEDDAASAQRFADEHGASWPLLTDPDNSAWHAYFGALVPTTWYIDRQGIVRGVSYGPPPSGTLEDQIAKIL